MFEGNTKFYFYNLCMSVCKKNLDNCGFTRLMIKIVFIRMRQAMIKIVFIQMRQVIIKIVFIRMRQAIIKIVFI